VASSQTLPFLTALSFLLSHAQSSVMLAPVHMRRSTEERRTIFVSQAMVAQSARKGRQEAEQRQQAQRQVSK